MLRAHEEAIVLFPRSYNKRGDEKLHSVQGVTLDGTEVNIKLRIDTSRKTRETPPSIAEFSRTDIKAKNLCLASPENSRENREGILLFTNCELEESRKNTIPTYVAKWAFVLADHSETNAPIFGKGRIALIINSEALRRNQEAIKNLQDTKPIGWEALVEQKRRELDDPSLHLFHGHIYDEAREVTLPLTDKAAVIEYAKLVFDERSKHGAVMGLLARLEGEAEAPEGYGCQELFPRWSKQTGKYQPAEDVLSFYFANLERIKVDKTLFRIRLMPIRRYAAGTQFKNYYLSRDPGASMAKLKQKFLINNEPTICQVAFTLTKREEGGDHFLGKYYVLDAPESSVARLGLKSDDRAMALVAGAIDPFARLPLGICWPSPISLPEWCVGAPPINDVEALAHDHDDLTLPLPEETEGVPETLEFSEDLPVPEVGQDDVPQGAEAEEVSDPQQVIAEHSPDEDPESPGVFEVKVSAELVPDLTISPEPEPEPEPVAEPVVHEASSELVEEEDDSLADLLELDVTDEQLRIAEEEREQVVASIAQDALDTAQEEPQEAQDELEYPSDSSVVGEMVIVDSAAAGEATDEGARFAQPDGVTPPSLPAPDGEPETDKPASGGLAAILKKRGLL